MTTPGQRPSSSSRDLTLVVESESGTPEEFFAQVALSIGRATSNTIYIDHPDVDRIHAKVVKRGEAFWLQCEPQAKLQVLEPEPGEVGEVELMPGLTIELGGMIIRCRRQMRGMSGMSDDYWAEAAGGERFRVETEPFTGDLPKKIGPYEIRRYVARGGMGIVLQGVHEETGQPVAVKLPVPKLNEDPQLLRRFEQEIRTLRKLAHPNIVGLQDAGKQGDLHWMAMEWVEGFTVGKWLAEWNETQRKVPLEQIGLFMLQMVEGLGYLHSHGVVHRDLKPANLLVGEDSIVKVADFGLAKQVGSEQSTSLTGTGHMPGTISYMAPEQGAGLDPTPATDIYALGIIWHELLTGKIPSRGSFKLDKLRPDCPPGWLELVKQTLEDKPEERATLPDIKHAIEAGVDAEKAAADRAARATQPAPAPAPTSSGGAPPFVAPRAPQPAPAPPKPVLVEPAPPNISAHASQSDTTGGMIPYKNVPGLVGYYMSCLGLLIMCIPILGFIYGIVVMGLGIKGLKKVKANPEVKGKIHCWIAIIGGFVELVVGVISSVLLIIGLLEG